MTPNTISIFSLKHIFETLCHFLKTFRYLKNLNLKNETLSMGTQFYRLKVMKVKDNAGSVTLMDYYCWLIRFFNTLFIDLTVMHFGFQCHILIMASIDMFNRMLQQLNINKEREKYKSYFKDMSKYFLRSYSNYETFLVLNDLKFFI